MSTLICFLFVSCGISAIWSLSDIFIPARNFVAKKAPSFLRKMLLCMECSSFWIGFICNFVFFPAMFSIQYEGLIGDIISGIYGGSATYFTIKLINKKELL